MIRLQKKSSYKLINRIKRWFWVTRAEPDMPVLFTHCGFMAIMLLAAPSQSVIAPSLSVILMIDPHITNYTAQRCPSSHSSTPTFINILLVSLGAAHFIPPSEKKRKVWCCCCCYSRVPIFLVTKTRFVLGSDTSGKTNIGGSLSQRLPWLQSHFPDDWIQSVLSLAASPDSQRRRDISDSDVLPYRLQAAASKRCGWKEEEKPDRRPSFDLDSLSHSSCTFEKRLSQWSPPRHEPLVRRYTNKTWSATLRGQTGGASGVNVSTSPARREVSYRLLEGQGQCPL